MTQFRSLLVSVLFSLLPLGAVAADQAPALTPDHPEHYVVRPGDTLWDISGRFLRDPWRWPEVWEGNRSIANPHLIYPGDVIWLSYRDGQPRLSARRPAGRREIKLQPGIRRETLTEAIPTIPLDAIRPFLTRPRVLSEDELSSAPRVEAFVSEHIAGGAGDPFYAGGLESPDVRSYDVVRPGEVYRDPDTGEDLGLEADYLGDAELVRAGEPSKLMLASANREIQLGDRLLPDPEDEELEDFVPNPAPPFVEGKIISVLSGIDQIGRYSIVVITAGEDEGLQPGDVMHILKRSRPPRSMTLLGRRSSVGELPLEEVGTLMVFRSFEKVSYALVMQATSAIHVNDEVRSPEG
jgi:hypothetical protein